MLLSLLITLPPLNGEQAIALTRRTLVEFGYRAPLRLQRLTANDDRSRWQIEFCDRRKEPASATVRSEPGEVTDLQVPHRPYAYEAKAEDQVIHRKWAEAFVKRLHKDQSIQFASLSASSDGIVHAAYKRVIDGRTFLSENVASYRVSFDANTGTFVSFSIRAVPRIDARPIRLDQAKAESQIYRIFEGIRTKFTNPTFKAASVDYGPIRFGYLVLDGETVARKVWTQTATLLMESPYPEKDRKNTFIIDAVTGEVVYPR